MWVYIHLMYITLVGYVDEDTKCMYIYIWDGTGYTAIMAENGVVVVLINA